MNAFCEKNDDKTVQSGTDWLKLRCKIVNKLTINRRATIAGNRNVLVMCTVMSTPATVRTITNERLLSGTAQVVQPDAPSTTKVSVA